MKKLTTALISITFLAACGSAETPSAGEAAPAVTSTPAASTQSSPEETGKRLFKACAVCHAVTADASRRVGPHLEGVYGRAPASLDNFSYSNALRSLEAPWNEAELDAWLENPRAYAPGNIMSWAGEKDAEKRRALIAYMKSL